MTYFSGLFRVREESAEEQELEERRQNRDPHARTNEILDRIEILRLNESDSNRRRSLFSFFSSIISKSLF